MSKCDVCLSHYPHQFKELIQQHAFAARPWSKMGADLCELQGRTLLVVSDYYSDFVEVGNITKSNTQVSKRLLWALFSWSGVPDILITDNRPQFSSESQIWKSVEF